LIVGATVNYWRLLAAVQGLDGGLDLYGLLLAVCAPYTLGTLAAAVWLVGALKAIGRTFSWANLTGRTVQSEGWFGNVDPQA
jgi:hypothetical protein